MTKIELIEKINARGDFDELNNILTSIAEDTNDEHATANSIIRKHCKTILNMSNAFSVDAVAMLEAAQRLIGAADTLEMMDAEVAELITEPGCTAEEDTLEHAKTIGWGITQVCREALYA